jgi:hypothetical protein
MAGWNRIAAKANMRLGDNQHKKEGVSIDTPSISLEQAAELLNVGRAWLPPSNLNESQRAVIAARLANMRRGAPEGNQNASREKTKVSIDTFVSLEQAADLLSVSPCLVARRDCGKAGDDDRHNRRASIKNRANLHGYKR